MMTTANAFDVQPTNASIWSAIRLRIQKPATHLTTYARRAPWLFLLLFAAALVLQAVQMIEISHTPATAMAPAAAQQPADCGTSVLCNHRIAQASTADENDMARLSTETNAAPSQCLMLSCAGDIGGELHASQSTWEMRL